MCQSLTETAASLPSLQMKAQAISTKFFDAFTLFSHCHEIYDSSTFLTNDDIHNLGKKL